MYSAQHGESADMQHDPLESGHDLDLRSSLVFDLFGSNYASFEAGRRDKHDGDNVFLHTFIMLDFILS